MYVLGAQVDATYPLGDKDMVTTVLVAGGTSLMIIGSTIPAWGPVVGILAAARWLDRYRMLPACRRPLSDPILRALPASVSPGRRGGAGAGARRARAGRDRPGRAAPRPRASERAGEPPGGGTTRRGAGRADGREPDRALRGAGGAAADRPPSAAGPRGREGGVVLARDGRPPAVGHAGLWVIRDGLTGEPLLARRLLSVTEAARPSYAAARHATQAVPTTGRGVRPIERAVAGRDEPAAAVPRGDGLAVRSASTDDGRPPLAAAASSAVPDSTRSMPPAAGGTRGRPAALPRLHALVVQGLTTTATRWLDIRTACGWGHQAARLLEHDDAVSGDEIRRRRAALLAEMTDEQATVGTLQPAGRAAPHGQRQLLARPVPLRRRHGAASDQPRPRAGLRLRSLPAAPGQLPQEPSRLLGHPGGYATQGEFAVPEKNRRPS